MIAQCGISYGFGNKSQERILIIVTQMVLKAIGWHILLCKYYGEYGFII